MKKMLIVILTLFVLLTGCSVTKNENSGEAYLKGIPLGVTGLNLVDVGFKITNKQSLGEDIKNEWKESSGKNIIISKKTTRNKNTQKISSQKGVDAAAQGIKRGNADRRKNIPKEPKKPSPLIPFAFIGIASEWLRRKL